MHHQIYKTTEEFENEKENTLRESRDLKVRELIDNFIQFAEKKTKPRRNQFDELMSFTLDGDQWTGSELNEKEDENKESLVFNFSEEYVERYMARLFPRNPLTGVMEVGIKVSGESDLNRKKYEDEVLTIYKSSKLAEIILEQGINYLIGGDACIYYPQDPITKRAELFSIDPKKVYLGWKGNKLVQFAFIESIGNNEIKTTYWDLQRKVVMTDEKIIVEKNPLNFVPASWIPNFPKPHKHEGRSKILSIFGLDREYNKSASNYSDRVDDNTTPHMVLKSDSVNITDIERGRKKKSKIGKDDSLEYLETQEGQEIPNWLDKIAQRISQKTGVRYSTGDVKTNVSGKSVSFQLSDMMDLIGFMRIYWDQSFRDMNTAILSYRFGMDLYNTDPVYQPFIANDNSERIDQYTKMREMDVISRRDVIDELRGSENADEEIQEILKEKEQFNKNKEQSNEKD